jgi:hypothetical protein
VDLGISGGGLLLHPPVPSPFPPFLPLLGLIPLSPSSPDSSTPTDLAVNIRNQKIETKLTLSPGSHYKLTLNHACVKVPSASPER